MDVVLNKVMFAVRNTLEGYRDIWNAVERMMEDSGISSTAVESKQRPGSPWGISKLPSELALCATYFMADMGRLPRDNDVRYARISRNGSSFDGLDTALLADLKRAVRQEMDCTVCYNIFLSPFTTLCGHTFCRRCTQEALSYSNSCPICRKQRAIPRCLEGSEISRNLLLSHITNAFWCTELANRRDAETTTQVEGSEEDLESLMEELDTPIFVCACSLPETPTPLHVFEPRYRKMIQRVMQTESKMFGMVLPNPSMEAQGDLGPVHFHQYGTMLRITEISTLADGRSIVITRGISRFRIVKHGMRDGYLIGKIQLFDDLTIGAEEALEQRETAFSTTRNLSADGLFGSPPHHATTGLNFTTMSTHALHEHCVQFIKNMKASSAPWLTQSTLRALGDCPNDPAILPWWFASVLPTSEESKYELLCESSVRKRLQMCASWVQYVRNTQSYVDPSFYSSADVEVAQAES